MDYEVLLNGEPFNARIEDIQITDRQGAQADDIKLTITNIENVSISKGSSLECVFGGFSSGKMNVDYVSSGTVTAQIGAISTPIDAKIKRTRHWLKVRLFDIVNDMAVNCGLSVYYHGVENWYYENVTQFRETDLAFLGRLCNREGYILKVDGNRLVIYARQVIESMDAVKKIGVDDLTKNRISFSENPNNVKSVTVKYFSDRLITHTSQRGEFGEDIIVNEYVADEAEAERFAYNYLLAMSESAVTVDCLIPITDGIAAGNCVEFTEFAKYNGKYLIYECCHNPEKNQTRLRGRRIA